MRPAYPRGYRAIERALILFARGHDDHEIRFLVRRINHPAAQEAAELLARGLRFRAQTVLDVALEAMAGRATAAGSGGLRRGWRRRTRRSEISIEERSVGSAERWRQVNTGQLKYQLRLALSEHMKVTTVSPTVPGITRCGTGASLYTVLNASPVPLFPEYKV